jgi:hypothetical protein
LATIEFADEKEALYAQTKSVKPFGGNDITIEFTTGTTLWVTNYPPEADKDYIRNLFSEVTSLNQLSIVPITDFEAVRQYHRHTSSITSRQHPQTILLCAIPHSRGSTQCYSTGREGS